MSIDNFQIIPATETHRKYVVSIIMNRWQESEEDANSEFTRWLCNDLNSICYVGVIDGAPMATGAFDTFREEDGLNISPYNTLLWVEPKCRGNNYGKMLTDIRFKWALSKGYKIIYLDTLDAEKYHIEREWKFLKHVIHNDKKYTIMQYVLDNTLSFEITRNIFDYAPILKPLAKDFTAIFYQTMLIWCKIIESDNARSDRLWEVWLVRLGNKPIGVCGLYTLHGALDTKELWLGWLGIIPELRNMNLGKQIMKHLYVNAKKFGADKIFSYVDKDGAPLPFYKREGFSVVSTVAEYCKAHGLNNIDGSDFEDDFVIYKELT